MKLSETPVGQTVVVDAVGGERSFRRRLLELGLLPGTQVKLLRIAPLGDPLELLALGGTLSIRKREAQQINVTLLSKDSRSETTSVTDKGALV